MRFFKPDLSSLGGVFKAPKLGPRHDKMAAHVSESPTTVLLPRGYDDIVNSFFILLCNIASQAFIFCFEVKHFCGRGILFNFILTCSIFLFFMACNDVLIWIKIIHCKNFNLWIGKIDTFKNFSNGNLKRE